jgi:hypothetical protein
MFNHHGGNILSTITKLLSGGLFGMTALAGCAAETGTPETTEATAAASDELTVTSSASLDPCPPCPTTACVSSGTCLGTKWGATGCTYGATSSHTKAVAPESWARTTCEPWSDRTSGQGDIYSRTCTQHSSRQIHEIGKCTQWITPGAGPYQMRWQYTYLAEAPVKRHRSEEQFLLVVPIASTSPWTPWTAGW